MIVLGILLLILGFFLKVPVLGTIGIILLVIGAVLWVAGQRRSPRRRQALLVLTQITGKLSPKHLN